MDEKSPITGILSAAAGATDHTGGNRLGDLPMKRCNPLVRYGKFFAFCSDFFMAF